MRVEGGKIAMIKEITKSFFDDFEIAGQNKWDHESHSTTDQTEMEDQDTV